MPDQFSLHYLHGPDFPQPTEEIVALYRNGQLIACDIQPKIVARAIAMLDMKRVYFSDMLLGGESAIEAAATEAEVTAFTQAKKNAEAQVLRDQAQALLDQAAFLENGGQ